MTEIKCRSPYLFIRPLTELGAIYRIAATGSTASYTYIDKATGNTTSQIIPPYAIEYTNCAQLGTVAGPSFSFDSYCGATYSPTVEYDTIKYQVKSWNGAISSEPTEIAYYKEKQKVVNAQETIYINLSNLLKERIEGDITNYMASGSPTITQPIGINESKWGKVEGDFYSNGEPQGRTFSETFFVIDGYTEPRETQSLSKILLTGSERSVVRYSKERIHFKLENLSSIIYYTQTNPATFSTITLSGTTSNSNEYIKSVNVNTSFSTTYRFRYIVAGIITDYYININVYDECKYEVFDVVFKNKWGVLETVSFSKKMTKALTVEDDDYLRSIVDYNGSYDITRHTRKHFNTMGYEEWTLNTDFLDESMNDPLRELMLSEEIWLCRSGIYIPINKADTSITFKTSLNDKLIQYTMKVKLSHNIINNIL